MKRLAVAAALLLAAAVTVTGHQTQAVYCPTWAVTNTNPDSAYGYCTSVDYHIVIQCIDTTWDYVTLSGPVRNQPSMSTRYCTSGHPILVNRWMVP